MGFSNPAKGKLEKVRTDLHRITRKTSRQWVSQQPAEKRLDKIKYNENNELTNDRLKVNFLITPEAETFRCLGVLPRGGICVCTHCITG